MIGNEAERQFYLAAAGIRMWYARAPLPGAAPSADFDFAELDAVAEQIPEPESPDAQPSAKTERSKDHIAKLQSLMESKQSPSAEPERLDPPVPVAEVPAPEASPSIHSSSVEASTPEPVDQISRDTPRATLQAWVGERVVLVATLSDESSLALQQTLAGNILKALGELSPQALDIIRWPLFNNVGVGLNHVSHLVEVLSGQLNVQANKWIVSLGESGDWLEAALGREPDVRLAASLANLAGDPVLKRELWQLLKRVRSAPS